VGSCYGRLRRRSRTPVDCSKSCLTGPSADDDFRRFGSENHGRLRDQGPARPIHAIYRQGRWSLPAGWTSPLEQINRPGSALTSEDRRGRGRSFGAARSMRPPCLVAHTASTAASGWSKPCDNVLALSGNRAVGDVDATTAEENLSILGRLSVRLPEWLAG
jgi:hypothetical protein